MEPEGVREYRGGVLYFASGVGAAEDGGKPRSFLCSEVRAISDKSSSCLKRGMTFQATFAMGRNCINIHIQSRPHLRFVGKLIGE